MKNIKRTKFLDIIYYYRDYHLSQSDGHIGIYVWPYFSLWLLNPCKIKFIMKCINILKIVNLELLPIKYITTYILL